MPDYLCTLATFGMAATLYCYLRLTLHNFDIGCLNASLDFFERGMIINLFFLISFGALGLAVIAGQQAWLTGAAQACGVQGQQRPGGHRQRDVYQRRVDRVDGTEPGGGLAAPDLVGNPAPHRHRGEVEVEGVERWRCARTARRTIVER